MSKMTFSFLALGQVGQGPWSLGLGEPGPGPGYLRDLLKAWGVWRTCFPPTGGLGRDFCDDF